jgi:hypothetical protein
VKNADIFERKNLKKKTTSVQTITNDKFQVLMLICITFFSQITVPFQYEWLDQLFKELATVAFFVVTGYKFRPANDNPYLQVPVDSDEEVEMEEV